MLVLKSLWTLPSPVLWNQVRLDTSRKQVQCHRCFLFARIGPKWEYEARVGKAKCLPPPSSGPNAEATHYRKLAESKGKRLQCRRSLCQDVFLFVCLFQVALGKAPGCTRNAVCMRDWPLRDSRRSRSSFFLTSKRPCSLFSSSTLSDERCSNLSFDSPNQNPKNRTLNSHRDTGCARRVLYCGRWSMYGHLPLTKLGFLAVQLWPVFLLKYSLRRARLQLV